MKILISYIYRHYPDKGYKADVRYAAGKYKNLFASHNFDNTIFPSLENAITALHKHGVTFFKFDSNCFE